MVHVGPLGEAPSSKGQSLKHLHQILKDYSHEILFVDTFVGEEYDMVHVCPPPPSKRERGPLQGNCVNFINETEIFKTYWK